MKRWQSLQLLIGLIGTLATSALGQTIYTWTGVANGTNMSTPGNWTTNGVDPATTLPNGNNGLGDGFQDIAQWDGRTTTNLRLVYNTTWPNTGFASMGVNLVMTSNQTNDVQITTALATSAGLGVNHVTNNSPNTSFVMGDNSANNWLVFGRPAGAVHHYVNNSTAPVIINSSVKFQAGGGSGYTYAFGGTGDWIVNSYLMPDANAFSPSPITVNGPGTVFWHGGKTGSYNPNSILGTVTVNGGALVIKTNGLFTGTAKQAIANHGTFIYDAAAAQTLNGVISGGGILIVSNGTLTLSGPSSYSGGTIVSSGKLVFQGAKTGAGDITVADGAILGIFDTGVQITSGTLGVGTSSGSILEFGNVNSTTTAPLAADTIFAAGMITININSGTFTVGQSYPLLTWNSGSTPSVSLATTNGFSGGLSFSGTTMLLNVTGISAPALNVTQAGSSLQFSWNNGFGNYKLQSQTNSLSVGISANWGDYPGGDTGPVTVPMNAEPGAIFFRLVSSP